PVADELVHQRVESLHCRTIRIEVVPPVLAEPVGAILGIELRSRRQHAEYFDAREYGHDHRITDGSVAFPFRQTDRGHRVQIFEQVALDELFKVRVERHPILLRSVPLAYPDIVSSRRKSVTTRPSPVRLFDVRNVPAVVSRAAAPIS